MEPKTYLVIVKRTDGVLAPVVVRAFDAEGAALRAMSREGVANVMGVFVR